MAHSKRKSPAPEKPRTPRQQPYPKGLGTAMLAVALATTAVATRHAIKENMNPDRRDPIEMADDALNVRRAVDPKNLKEVTDSLVKKKAGDAACLLREKLHFWDENNQTIKESVKVRFKKGEPPVPYSYRPNLFHHVKDAYWDEHVNTLWQLSRDKEWKHQLGWLYESFKQKYPDATGKWETEKEQWEKHVIEVYMGQPVETPKWADGSPVKTWEGLTKEEIDELHEAQRNKDEATVKRIRSKARDCLLLRPAARSVTVANWLMYKDGKGEIEPMTCYRNNLQQAVLAVSIPGDVGCEFVANPHGDVQNPGQSAHGLGLAMDVANWETAEPYLSIVGGWQCRFVNVKFGLIGAALKLGNDNAHCSIGERGPSWSAKKQKKAAEAKLLAGDAGQFVKDHWRDWIPQ